MQDEASIQRQLQRERTFSPPYCPNPKCRRHLGGAGFWQKNGTKKIKRFPYLSQRFRCRDCSRTFSYSFFFLEYQTHVWGKNETIFLHHRTNMSMRESARILGHTERMIRGRKKKMNRWGILRHAKFCGGLKVEEPLVYDGLENFSFSQYDPNNINQAIGKESFFIYDFNFSPINRKGTMTPFQALKKKKLEEIHGAYPRDGLRTSTRRIFKRLLEKSEGKLTLYSDEHFQYRKVVEEDLKAEKIIHLKTSAKINRNYQNPLFAVNYVDLQVRQELAAFRRETIAFSKHSIAMMESYVLYALYRNYMRPKFFKAPKDDPLASQSPAMRLGLTKKILSFKEFFGVRVLKTQVPLNEDWANFYHRIDHLSRRPIKAAA